MHSAISFFFLGVAASIFALPLNTTDLQLLASITESPEDAVDYAFGGTAFIATNDTSVPSAASVPASSETSIGPTGIESPSSVDPPSSSDPPASSDPSPSNDPPVSLSSSLSLSPSPPAQLSGGAAMSPNAFKRKIHNETKNSWLRARYEAYLHG